MDEVMIKNAAFTVIAQNYVGYGIVLAESMKLSNPDVDFYIYFADGINHEISKILSDRNINYVDATKTTDADVFLSMAFKYEITEYCTSIKPFIISQLFKDKYDIVTYIDPDIYVYSDLCEPVFDKLKLGASIVLTPHICSPIVDDYLPGEQAHLKSGTYNLGFVSIKNNPIGRAIASWWSDKCENSCFNDSFSGLFVDQKWINLVPGMFDEVFISRHLGLNMAYWNLHEREISDGLVNGQYPLVFFHFSGFVPDDINVISKYQNRCTLENRPDLNVLFENYRVAVKAVINSLSDLPRYKYNYYSDGKKISLIARRCYYFKQANFETPFSNSNAEESFVKLLKENGIYETFDDKSIVLSSEINKKAKSVNILMRIFLRVLGPNRYVSLCKYFGFLSSIHQQRFILNEYKADDVVDSGRKHLKR